ncbi:MAG: TrkA family potassium uptake protein [Erysipelotrichaceae bacterium]|nr:TrkA family potassium uptake protein [Erysipelotrichaceae bacterium]
MKSYQEKQYVVLGLGIFGSTVAKTLSSYNYEVIALDKNMKCVDRLKDIVTQAVQCDITDINELRLAGVEDCDVAIVGMGNHLEETILAIINLKELGVKEIVVKAKNKRCEQIFLSVGASKIVRPEKEMGVIVAKRFLNNNIISIIDIDDEYSVMEINAPQKWVGKSLIDLDARRKYGINVIGIRKQGEAKLNISPEAEYVIEEHDHLMVIADLYTFEKFNFMNKV